MFIIVLQERGKITNLNHGLSMHYYLYDCSNTIEQQLQYKIQNKYKK